MSCDLLENISRSGAPGSRMSCRRKQIHQGTQTPEIDKRVCRLDVSVGIDSETLREKSEVA